MIWMCVCRMPNQYSSSSLMAHCFRVFKVNVFALEPDAVMSYVKHALHTCNRTLYFIGSSIGIQDQMSPYTRNARDTIPCLEDGIHSLIIRLFSQPRNCLSKIQVSFSVLPFLYKRIVATVLNKSCSQDIIKE